MKKLWMKMRNKFVKLLRNFLETLRIFMMANMIWGTLLLLVCSLLDFSEETTGLAASAAILVFVIAAIIAVRRGRTLIVHKKPLLALCIESHGPCLQFPAPRAEI